MIIKDSILNLLKKSDYWSIKQLVDELMVSKQAVHYAINQLLEENKIIRLGKPPKTIYKLKPKEENIANDAIIKSISDEDPALARILRACVITASCAIPCVIIKH